MVTSGRWGKAWCRFPVVLCFSLMAWLVGSGVARAELPSCAESSFVLLRYSGGLPVGAKKTKANARLFRKPTLAEAPQQRAPMQGLLIFANDGQPSVPPSWQPDKADLTAKDILLESAAESLRCQAAPTDAEKSAASPSLRQAVVSRTTVVQLPGDPTEDALASLHDRPELAALLGVNTAPPPPVPSCPPPAPPPAITLEQGNTGSFVVGVIGSSAALLSAIALAVLAVFLRRRVKAEDDRAIVVDRIATAVEKTPTQISSALLSLIPPVVGAGGTSGAPRGAGLVEDGACEGSGKFSPASARPQAKESEERKARWAERAKTYNNSPAARLGSCERAIALLQAGDVETALSDPWVVAVFREHERLSGYGRPYLERVGDAADVGALERTLEQLTVAMRADALANGIRLIVPRVGYPAGRYSQDDLSQGHPSEEDKTIRELNAVTPNGVIVDLRDVGWQSRGGALKRAAAAVWSQQWRV